MELTILMPCLNEEESVGFCIREAKAYLESRGIQGQILIADNASTDRSRELAQKAGAEVVTVAKKGYGSAIRGGIAHAKGAYIIVSDCDGSYDLSDLDEMVQKLRAGTKLVVGNRFLGGISPGGMPWLHRYFGVPMLSFLGKMRFGVNVDDFHCGLRGFCRETVRKLPLQCDGMEFATEIIGRFAERGYSICQIPTVLRKALRPRPSHLRPVSDGLRHLKLILFWRASR